MASKRANSNRPSIFSVAQCAGVSHQTVSRVINNSPNVSEKTRQKVLDAIAQLDYRPSNSARALASHKTRTIGLIAGGQRFYGPLSALASIEAVAREHNMFVSVAMLHELDCTQEDFNVTCNLFEQQGVDAFIFLAPTDQMFAAACNAQVSQPCTIITSTHGTLSIDEGLQLLSAHHQQKSISLVGVDQWGGMRSIMELVHHYGHKNTLFFAGPQHWRDAKTRLTAWNTLCNEFSIKTAVISCNQWDSGESYQQMNHIIDTLNTHELPTCVVCSNDVIAIGVIRALHEHGLRIPQDVSVTGFDDMPGMDNLYPPLTTVRQDFPDLGTMAMQETLHVLGQSEEPVQSISCHNMQLSAVHLIARQSLGFVSS